MSTDMGDGFSHYMIEHGIPVYDPRPDLPVIPKLRDNAPTLPGQPVAKCGECGRLIYAVEGYCRPNSRCPVQLHATC